MAAPLRSIVRIVPATAIVLLVLPAPASAGTVEGTVRAARLKSLKDVVVYLEGPDLPAPVPPAEPAVMDQKDIRFVPRVLPVVKGTTVRFPNSDDTTHNVHSQSDAKTFNLGTYPKGESRTVVFDVEGVVETLCHVHQEMLGFVIVLPSAFHARPADDGSFSIADVPPGRHRVVALHPELPPVKAEVIVDRKGVARVEILIP